MFNTIKILLLTFLFINLIFYFFNIKQEKQLLLQEEDKISKAVAITIKILYGFLFVFLVFNTPISWFFSEMISTYGISKGHLNIIIAISIILIIINPLIESNSSMIINKTMTTLPFLIILIGILFMTNMIVPYNQQKNTRKDNKIELHQQEINIPKGIEPNSIQVG